jgi:hypothetical protein
MIYVIKHKPCNVQFQDGFKEFGVGDLYTGAYPSLNKYNPYLNEITSLLDILNQDDNYVGLIHYRRYFDGLTFEKAKKILNTYDVITTTLYEPETPYKHLANALGDNLVSKYLAELPSEVNAWFYEHSAFNICSMFISKKEFLKGYCDWIFPIIIPITDKFIREDLSNDFKLNRTVGFITECLFGYYCKDFKKYENPITIKGEWKWGCRL